MTLTAAQLQTLKTDLAANTAPVPVNGVPTQVKMVPVSPDNAAAVAGWYNQQAAPAWVVWRTDLSKDDIDKAVDWAEVVALSTNSLLAFQLLKDQGKVDGSNASIRNAFGQVFRAATAPNSNAALLALAKRNATAAEKLLSTGTGTAASPATMGFEGPLGYQDVLAAWGA